MEALYTVGFYSYSLLGCFVATLTPLERHWRLFMTDFSTTTPTDLSSAPNQSTPLSPWDHSKPATYVDDYVPPTGMPEPVAETPAAQTPPVPALVVHQPDVLPIPPAAPQNTLPSEPEATKSETLEDQNIFHILGVEDATEDEKEAFLDELQQVIWEDFLENDVDLLLTEDEQIEFKKIADKKDANQEELQAEMVEFLEKLIPDLEKIMLEKALELKEEMMRERITQMAQLFATVPEKAAKVKEALAQADNNQWRMAANTLNTLSS
jgi:hypothetical protein